MSRLPTLRPRELVAAFKRAGFEERHQSGSHLILAHSDGRRIVIPIHTQDLPRGTMLAIIRQAGMTEEMFRQFL